MGIILRLKGRIMSLLKQSEDVPVATGVSSHVVHCNNCGKDYYVNVPANESVDSVIGNMECTCKQSELVAKGTVGGHAAIEYPE